jgi:hypothetical protein
MAADRAFYFDRLYPLQDQVLALLRQIETGFYLTGGTAASRGYLNHRFSDDLDLFVNDDRRFGLWADRLVGALTSRAGWTTEVTLREERFVRINLDGSGVLLKLELIDPLRRPARRRTAVDGREEGGCVSLGRRAARTGHQPTPVPSRQRPSLEAPGETTSLHRFPSFALLPTRALWRVTRDGHRPWWFGSTMEGRRAVVRRGFRSL